jgi:hypothetical protein
MRRALAWLNLYGCEAVRHKLKNKQKMQGYRNRYDIIDHEHEKKTFMYFFHRPIFAKIREFATIVLLNGIERFSESTLNSS